VKIQVEFNPARVAGYRLIGYENRLLRAEDFSDDTKDAGDMGAGHTVTALYEVVPLGADTDVTIRGLDSLRYRTPGAQLPSARSNELGFVKLRYKDPQAETSQLIEHVVLDAVQPASVDLRFAAAVAGFAMLLRDSEYCGSWTLADVLAAARSSLGDDPHGYRAEFVRLVEAVVRGELLAQ
jgi:Ca-activated chloride channel family protein